MLIRRQDISSAGLVSWPIVYEASRNYCGSVKGKGEGGGETRGAGAQGFEEIFNATLITEL